ncbi:MAG: hypothetical protein HY591_04570 [Candidatus Omnitrophica bacterium]|nr:hypothetical protein [Candidatus Omnitrophota bacterium]
MNVQKSIIAALCVHALAACVVWVGFPVPLPRGKVEFLYSGAFMPAEELPDGTSMEKAPGPGAVKSSEAGFFTPWVNMRSLDKPKR